MPGQRTPDRPHLPGPFGINLYLPNGPWCCAAHVLQPSLQEYLRAKLVELAGQPDDEVLMARVRARKMASASSLPRDRILAHRDEDRR
jgi:hypothetical protein